MFGPVLTLAALLAVLLIVLIHRRQIGFDQAKYVTMADMLWRGKTLYWCCRRKASVDDVATGQSYSQINQTILSIDWFKTLSTPAQP
jgi:hypothetical protein